MNIEIKILKFFSLRKEKGSEVSDLITLDRYLVNVTKEIKYHGVLLLEKIEEIEKKQFILRNDNNKYSITQKGLEYLNKNL